MRILRLTLMFWGAVLLAGLVVAVAVVVLAPKDALRAEALAALERASGATIEATGHARWVALPRPGLDIGAIRIGDGSRFSATGVILGIDVRGLLTANLRPDRIDFVGASLSVERRDDGGLALPFSPVRVASVRRLVMREAELDINDRTTDQRFQILDARLDLKAERGGLRTQLTGQLDLPDRKAAMSLELSDLSKVLDGGWSHGTAQIETPEESASFRGQVSLPPLSSLPLLDGRLDGTSSAPMATARLFPDLPASLLDGAQAAKFSGAIRQRRGALWFRGALTTEIRGRSVVLEGSLERASEDPDVSIDANARVGGLGSMYLQGRMAPSGLPVDADLSVSLLDLVSMQDWSGIPLPDALAKATTARLQGRLMAKTSDLRLAEVVLATDQGSFEGEVSVNVSGTRPVATVTLPDRALDLVSDAATGLARAVKDLRVFGDLYSQTDWQFLFSADPLQIAGSDIGKAAFAASIGSTGLRIDMPEAQVFGGRATLQAGQAAGTGPISVSLNGSGLDARLLGLAFDARGVSGAAALDLQMDLGLDGSVETASGALSVFGGTLPVPDLFGAGDDQTAFSAIEAEVSVDADRTVLNGVRVSNGAATLVGSGAVERQTGLLNGTLSTQPGGAERASFSGPWRAPELNVIFSAPPSVGEPRETIATSEVVISNAPLNGGQEPSTALFPIPIPAPR